MKKKKEKNIQIITNHEKNYLNATNKTKRRKICLLCPYSAEIFVKQKGIFAQARKLIEQVFNVRLTFFETVHSIAGIYCPCFFQEICHDYSW